MYSSSFPSLQKPDTNNQSIHAHQHPWKVHCPLAQIATHCRPCVSALQAISTKCKAIKASHVRNNREVIAVALVIPKSHDIVCQICEHEVHKGCKSLTIIEPWLLNNSTETMRYKVSRRRTHILIKELMQSLNSLADPQSLLTKLCPWHLLWFGSFKWNIGAKGRQSGRSELYILSSFVQFQRWAFAVSSLCVALMSARAVSI